MKKIAILVALTVAISCTPINMVKAFSTDITIPTKEHAFVDGKIKSKIEIDQKVFQVNPWMYIDVKLDATKSKQQKYNYAELALKRAFACFTEEKLFLKDGDFYIILNDGFVINKDNYKDKKVTDKAMKEILDNDYYRGDTLFKIAFLYHDNAVKKTTYWKLIDTIDLPAGSSHTIDKKYIAGITKNEELDMGQTLGLKLMCEVSGGSGFDIKYASAKILGKLNGDINFTLTNKFKNTSEVKSVFESTTKITYNPSDVHKLILRYQLVENYKVDEEAFNNATCKLSQVMNCGGVSIVKIAPSAGEEGIDVPSDKIFDVVIIQN